MIGVTVLGATGSIGTSTLDVLARHRDRFRVVALTAHSSVDALFERCVEHRPDFAVLIEEGAAAVLERRLAAAGLPTRVLQGSAALVEVASLPQVECVMAAIVGAAGLIPTLAAVQAGKRVLLANKEALVMSGALFMDAVRRSGAELVPIDSEHNAIFQCMPAGFRAGESRPEVQRILLTASGGPFRDWPLERLEEATPEQACAHPNWVMGPKISVDSATMMNKGLEVIEACWLFGLGPDQVEVVQHPQSIVHSLVAYRDGSVLAQLGQPDMRTPIACALAWPQRIESGVRALDLIEIGKLEFLRPDPRRYPCLGLAVAAQRAGGALPAVLNAANEVAVEAFLARRIRLTDIARVIEAMLEAFDGARAENLPDIIELDGEVRRAAAQRLAVAEENH